MHGLRRPIDQRARSVVDPVQPAAKGQRRISRSIEHRQVAFPSIALEKGHSNKLIAGACTCAEATVKVHMKSILRKIRMANRTQAAIWAVETGLRR